MTFGPDVTVTIPAGTIISLVSQADANAQALAFAKAEAESSLECVLLPVEDLLLLESFDELFPTEEVYLLLSGDQQSGDDYLRF
jgi:hypothetical protein